MSENLPKRPSHRREVKIAIICALSPEADMVEMVLDKDWADDGVKFGKAPGDLNTYTVGVVSGQNVVLAYCSTIGSNSAAQVATGLRSSFTGIRLAFVVGVCGAYPFADGEEILLGDCIISTAVIQFDLGRFGPKGFAIKDGLQGLGRAQVEIGSLLSKLKGRKSRLRLKKNLASHLQILQNEDPEWAQYPGRKEDRLFISSYKHNHGQDVNCEDCDSVTGICGKLCKELHCKDENLVLRKRLESDVIPSIHFGHFASSNSVIKDADKRDVVAKENKVIAFEMEGSGVWDIYPTIVIKAACDYADSHKNKNWQPYAAAVAASAFKAFLQELDFPDDESSLEDNATKLLEAKVTQNVNEFNSSTIHGSVASNVYGGIHYYQDQSVPSAVVPQQSDINLIARADAAIRDYYTSGDRLEILRLSGEILSLDKCYVNLALTDRADKKQQVEDPSFSMEARLRLEASTPDKQIALGDLFVPRKLSNKASGTPRRIFIQGRAGVGKTTLCKKIVHEFLHYRLGDNLFDRLIWIPLRRLKAKSEAERYGWQDVIGNVLPLKCEDWNEILVAISRKLLDKDYLARTLFLFDGLDEVSYQWKRDDSMYEFIADMICDTPNVIITSRPHANSFNVGRFDLDLETIGFSSDQIHTYMEKCVKNKELIPGMKEAIEQKPLLQSLLRIPIQLDAFCYTWPRRVSKENHESTKEHRRPQSSDHNDLSTMTTLYQAITSELCVKDADRLEKAAQPRRLHDTKIKTLLQQELGFLEELAFQGLINGLATFKPEQQDMVEAYLSQMGKANVHDSFVLEKLSFLRTSDIDQDPSKRNYHFLHLTFQEFFAAKHFVRHWRDNVALMCLDLGSGSSVVTGQLSPVEFLKLEKYNPQLNIFWRFVAGLTQARSYVQTYSAELHDISQCLKSKGVVEFFAELNDMPLDLLGRTHLRLLMCCLSEVIVDHHQETQALYNSQRSLIQSGVIAEFKRTQEFDTARQSEFSENMLYEFLQNNGEIPLESIIWSLEDRQFVTTETLAAISNLLNSKLSFDGRLKAIKLIFNKANIASQETLSYVTKIVQIMLEEQDLHTCNLTLDQLQFCPALPQQIVHIVIGLLKSEHELVWKSAAATLVYQKPMCPEIRDVLVTVLQSEMNGLLQAVLNSLKRCNDLPEAVIMLLIPLLKLDVWIIRNDVEMAIIYQESLSPGVMDSLVALLDDENPRIQTSIVRIFSIMESIPPSESVAKLVAMVKNGTTRYAVNALAKLSSLNPEDVTLLTAMLRSDYTNLQRWSAEALKGQLTLPEDTITALTIASKNKNLRLKAAAASTLQNHSRLSEEVLISLIDCLTGGAWARREAINVFANCAYLPEQVVIALALSLKETGKGWLDFTIFALGAQSSLPLQVVTILTTCLDGYLTDPIKIYRHIFTNINDLDDKAVQRVWLHCLTDIRYRKHSMSCYEYRGNLYIWLDGERHKITNELTQTQRILQLILRLQL